ncbi:MAG: hypothetical protein JXQ29_07995 [Planctomycetes bacterium]|nr:hypothetical protein [Planctomycetota bacterium]
MSIRYAAVAALAVLALAAAVAAQPYGTDLIVSDLARTLYRVTAAGGVTTIGTYETSGSAWSLTTDAGNEEVVATMTSQGGCLLRIHSVTGYAVTIATGLGRPYWTEVDHNGDYVVALLSGGPVIRVKRDGSSVITLRAGFVQTPIFTQDLLNGDWVAGDLVNGLTRYDHSWTTMLSTVNHTSTYTYEIIHDPVRPFIYLGAANLARYDVMANTVGVLNTGHPGVLGDRGLEIDRAPAASGAYIYTTDAVRPTTSSTLSTVWRYDPSGTNVGALATFSVAVTGLAFEHGRNLSAHQTSAPNNRILIVSFPADWGKSYVVAFSFSGYTPGIPLPDGRTIPLTPDALTALTVQQALPPLLRHNQGQLAANGGAQVTLDLNALGSAVSGLRLWAVAVTLDPSAPFGISQISRPFLMVL